MLAIQFFFSCVPSTAGCVGFCTAIAIGIVLEIAADVCRSYNRRNRTRRSRLPSTPGWGIVFCMFRLFHVLLTTSALLACPFHCMDAGGVLCAEAEQVQTQSCCPHCVAKNGPLSWGTAPPARNSDRQPSPPWENCQCGNCVCQGATVDDNDGLLNAGDDLVVPLIAAAFDDAVAAEISWRSRTHQSPLGRQPSSGRGVRVLLQSFLL